MAEHAAWALVIFGDRDGLDKIAHKYAEYKGKAFDLIVQLESVHPQHDGLRDIHVHGTLRNVKDGVCVNITQKTALDQIAGVLRANHVTPRRVSAEPVREAPRDKDDLLLDEIAAELGLNQIPLTDLNMLKAINRLYGTSKACKMDGKVSMYIRVANGLGSIVRYQRPKHVVLSNMIELVAHIVYLFRHAKYVIPSHQKNLAHGDLVNLSIFYTIAGNYVRRMRGDLLTGMALIGDSNIGKSLITQVVVHAKRVPIDAQGVSRFAVHPNQCTIVLDEWTMAVLRKPENLSPVRCLALGDNLEIKIHGGVTSLDPKWVILGSNDMSFERREEDQSEIDFKANLRRFLWLKLVNLEHCKVEHIVEPMVMSDLLLGILFMRLDDHSYLVQNPSLRAYLAAMYAHFNHARGRMAGMGLNVSDWVFNPATLKPKVDTSPRSVGSIGHLANFEKNA